MCHYLLIVLKSNLIGFTERERVWSRTPHVRLVLIIHHVDCRRDSGENRDLAFSKIFFPGGPERLFFLRSSTGNLCVS